MEIVTGEKLQVMCDYYIGKMKDFRFSRSQRYKEKNKTIDIDHDNIINEFIEKINNNKKNILIFIYTHIIYSNLPKVIYILSMLNVKFNLVIHNSDYAFKNKHLVLFNIKNLNKIFTQNIDVTPNNNLIPLPIGMANSQWRHGCLRSMEKVLEYLPNIQKTEFFYFNFNIKTNSKKRLDCYNKIMKSKYKIKNIGNMRYPDYLKNLAKYKFAICPEGNGLDTHRFWECLYLKVVPICLKNEITIYFSNIFPIKLVNDWSEIDNFNIYKWYKKISWKNYNLLNFKHYSNMINITQINYL